MYGSIEMIKYRLKYNTATTVATDDAQMTIALTEASAIIDNKLGYYTSIPLSSTADIIGYIAADYGAAMFRNRQIPSTIRLIDSSQTGEELWRLGDSLLAEYIRYNLGYNLNTDGELIMSTMSIVQGSTSLTADYEVIT